jgi:hypothetical protein
MASIEDNKELMAKAVEFARKLLMEHAKWFAEQGAREDVYPLLGLHFLRCAEIAMREARLESDEAVLVRIMSMGAEIEPTLNALNRWRDYVDELEAANG